MYKLVVLLSVVALAAANPSGVLTPVTYNAVIPGQSSLSQYSTSIVHGSPAVVPPAVYTVPQAVYSVPAAYRPALVAPVALSGLHHLGKRSVGVVVGPATFPRTISYSTPIINPYPVYPRALSVHPY